MMFYDISFQTAVSWTNVEVAYFRSLEVVSPPQVFLFMLPFLGMCNTFDTMNLCVWGKT